MNNEVKLKGRYQVRIMEVLNTHKIIRHSLLSKILKCKKGTLSYTRDRLIEQGLIERHGDYLCLPDYADEVLRLQKRK